MSQSWPRPLRPAQGPMRADRLAGAAEGMGDWGAQCRRLAADGIVPPDMMTGLTLFLLSSQPRGPDSAGIPGGGGGVAGGVWVRERFTITRPLAAMEAFSVTGESVGRHVRKGRRYGTTRCETRNASGELIARNLTTGLLEYRIQEALGDSLEGEDPDQIETPPPDWSLAASNPCLAALRGLAAGDDLTGPPVLVSLAMMAARDTKRPDNPIHSDPELARRAGLSRPIAGGSHVLSFALESILQRIGHTGLLYGASFDIRWKAPVYADVTIQPRAWVTAAAPDRVTFAVEALLAGDVTAMTGRVTVPLA